MKKVRLLKGKSKTMPWEVHVHREAFGKRIRKRFKTRIEAEHEMAVLEARITAKEQKPLDPELHRVVMMFAEKLTTGQFMASLQSGLERFSKTDCSLDSLRLEYETYQNMLFERGSVGEAQINNIKCLGPKLVTYLDNPSIQSVTSEMLDGMVDTRLASTNKKGMKVSPRTVKNELSILSAMFNFAIKKGYALNNPCKDVVMPDYKAEVGVCKPEDISNLLSHACHYIQCWIMFGAFGGLRSSEIFRMCWDDVRISEGQFYIKGSKNEGAERWVKMTPPLMAFCKDILEADNTPSGLVMGGMTCQTKDRKMKAIVKKAGYKIPKNGLRHSFGSHHLIQYDNPFNTATEMGHLGPQTTFKAYRKAVLKSQAVDYFNIRCEAKPWVVITGLGSKKPRKSSEKIAA